MIDISVFRSLNGKRVSIHMDNGLNITGRCVCEVVDDQLKMISIAGHSIGYAIDPDKITWIQISKIEE